MAEQTSLIFKIGATRIVADESMAQLNHEQVRDLLKRTYPEVAHATLREREENGLRVLEFPLSRVGKANGSTDILDVCNLNHKLSVWTLYAFKSQWTRYGSIEAARNICIFPSHAPPRGAITRSSLSCFLG